MKNLFYLILGIVLVTLVSATTVSIMTVKPAKPISTTCFTGYGEGVKSQILNYASQGYILKQIEANGHTQAQFTYYVVVMEKY